MMKQILAFSSSRVDGGGYLQEAVPHLQTLLGNRPATLAFVAFASVDSYTDYAEKAQQALESTSYRIELVTPGNAASVIDRCDAVVIGGGNTFKLLHDLHAFQLLKSISNKIENGTPYIGWSAGSNLTGPTICTTNDMPILQPESFAAFGFFPFQINPHYHNAVVEGFHGETRDQRLEEYLKTNSGKSIMCLPEGSFLKLEGDALLYSGTKQGVLMTREEGLTVHRIIHPQADVSYLLKS